ncbi:MAG: hypothetical protein ACI3VB_09520 [Oscillospiraceae bacterium]
MRNVIVTDLRYRMAMAPVRTLFRAGYKVTGVELESTPPKKAIGFYSKCLSDKRFLPDREEALLEALMKLCREKTVDGVKPVILPVGRKFLNLLQEHPELSEQADFLVPSRESMELSDDKGEMYKLAVKLGIPAPVTSCLSECASLENLSERVKYPCFIKFRNGELLGLKPAERYRIAKSPKELMELYPQMEKRDHDPLVQEYAAGRDLGVAAVMGKDGELRDFICYESLREFPASGGPTCLCRTFLSPVMAEYAQRLLKALDFSGMAMLDFRGSAQEPRLLEINPRVWGSANLCDVSGSSFFVSYVRAAAGEPSLLSDINEPLYKNGVTMRFSPQNAASFISYVKSGRPLLKTAGEYIKTALDRSIAEGFDSPDDHGPYRRYIKNLIFRK